jgi:hypothetical protein
VNVALKSSTHSYIAISHYTECAYVLYRPNLNTNLYASQSANIYKKVNGASRAHHLTPFVTENEGMDDDDDDDDN